MACAPPLYCAHFMTAIVFAAWSGHEGTLEEHKDTSVHSSQAAVEVLGAGGSPPEPVAKPPPPVKRADVDFSKELLERRWPVRHLLGDSRLKSVCEFDSAM